MEGVDGVILPLRSASVAVGGRVTHRRRQSSSAWVFPLKTIDFDECDAAFQRMTIVRRCLVGAGMLASTLCLQSGIGSLAAASPQSLAQVSRPEPGRAERDAHAREAESSFAWRTALRRGVPTGRPIVVGDVVFWTSPMAIHAAAVGTGLPAWGSASDANVTSAESLDGGDGGVDVVSPSDRPRSTAIVGIDLFTIDPFRSDQRRGGMSTSIIFQGSLAEGDGRVIALIGPVTDAAVHDAVKATRVVALDAGPAEGRIEWTASPPIGFSHFASVPVVSGERILIAVARGSLQTTTAVASLQSSDGLPEWCVTLPLESGRAGGDRPCVLGVASGRVVAMTNDGIAAIEPSGRIEWVRAWDRGPPEFAKRGPGQPRPLGLAIADERIVAISPDGLTLVCLAADDGRTLWQMQLDESIAPSVAVGRDGHAATRGIETITVSPDANIVAVAANGLVTVSIEDGTVTGRFGVDRYRSAGQGVFIDDVFYWPARPGDGGVSDETRSDRGSTVIVPLSTPSLEPVTDPLPTDAAVRLTAASTVSGDERRSLLVHARDGLMEARLTPLRKDTQ